jgi:hypothetical protein
LGRTPLGTLARTLRHQIGRADRSSLVRHAILRLWIPRQSLVGEDVQRVRSLWSQKGTKPRRTMTLSSGLESLSTSAPHSYGSSAKRYIPLPSTKVLLSPDFLDLLFELSEADAKYLVVGGYAVGVHGHPRATRDLDVWVEASRDNAPKVLEGLLSFGAPLMGLTEQDLTVPGVGLRIGVEPGRIDVLTKVTGIDFAQAWAGRLETTFGGVMAHVIGLRELLANKRAAGRPQDIADVAALEGLERALARART